MGDERVDLWVTPQPTAMPLQNQQQAAPPQAPRPLQPAQRQLSVATPHMQLGTLPMAPAQGVIWWALGVHGGAGVSTLLRTVGGGGDALRRWPDIHGAISGVHVVLVARADAHGLACAQAALQEWHTGLAPASTHIAGLVLMADAPTKPPRSVRDRVRVLTGAVEHSWEVPWVEEWREGGRPAKRIKALVSLEDTLRQLPPPQITLALPPGSSPQPQNAPQPAQQPMPTATYYQQQPMRPGGQPGPTGPPGPAMPPPDPRTRLDLNQPTEGPR
ncbi:hypothetical protein ACH4NT_36515 [Streptomyces lydicus]|uniref:hypothetical protein n=1 Tax=Streptomyces lydicus TaxID=47763 RepID=UPI0037BE19CE